VIPSALEKLEDDVAVIEQARRLLTSKVDKGDPVSGREVLAFLRLRIDWRRYTVFSDVEMTLLGAWLGDFDFLTALKNTERTRDDGPEPTCCGRWRDGLMGALLARAPDARRLVSTAASLGEADRQFVDLLLFTVVESRSPRDTQPAINERGEAYLARFPDTPYRGFLLDNIVERWRPVVGMSLRGYAAWPFLDGDTDRVFRQRGSLRPGIGMGLLLGRHVTLELQFAETGTAPRQPLTVDGRLWPQGADTTLTSWAVMLGYQQRWGGHALGLATGLGADRMKYKFGDGKDDSSGFSAFAGSAALEYQLDLLRSAMLRRGRGGQDVGLVLCARAGVHKAFAERQGIAPLVFLFELGAGLDMHLFMREHAE
jgi:hypothetical protein